MKTPLIALAILSGASVCGGAETPPPRTARAALTEKLKQDFPYAIRPEQKAAVVEASGSVVLMERVIVAETDETRRLKAQLDLQSEKRQAERLTFTQGGALLKKDFGKIRIELGARGDSSGLTLFKVSW